MVPPGAVAFVILLVYLTFGAPSLALADGPLGPNGAPITTSAYNLDAFQGPILASGRTTALAGSTGAIPEGALGNMVSSASPAARDPWSTDWFDWDLDASFSVPTTLKRSDFDNNGRSGLAYESFLYGALGGLLQFGKWGVSFGTEASTFELGAQDQTHLQVQLTRGRVVVARQFFEGALIFGAGFRTLSLGFDAVAPNGDKQRFFDLTGTAFQGGALFAPRGLPFRLAAEWRSSVQNTEPAGTVAPDEYGDVRLTDGQGHSLYLPTGIRLPWEVEFAGALQLGKRPLNVPYHDPSDQDRALAQRLINDHEAFLRKWHGRGTTLAERKELVAHAKAIRRERDRARVHALPRQKVLLTASLLVSGSVSDAVGTESFLLQTVERSGRRLSFTPRAGVEIEPLPGRLQVRGGSYLEPSRFDHRQPRLHGTFGFDVRVFESAVWGVWDKGTRWRIGTFVDAAPRYLSVSGTLGVWH